MHYYYLPEIDGSEGLSFVIGTTNCLRESCLHKAHVDVRGVSPFTDTAGDMLLSEISLNWLHKEFWQPKIQHCSRPTLFLLLWDSSPKSSSQIQILFFFVFFLFIELSSKSCFYFSFALSVVVLSRLLSLL